MFKNLSCVSCGSLKRFPHTFTTLIQILIYIACMQVIHVIKHAHDIKGDLNFDYNKRGIEIFRNMDKSGDMRINCEEFVNACMTDSELCLLLEDMFGALSEIRCR